MHSLGKEIRLKRLIREESNSSVICALDLGMSSPTFLSGLVDMKARVREAQEGGANVFMLSKGFARIVVDELNRDTSFAMMLSASAAGWRYWPAWRWVPFRRRMWRWRCITGN